MISVTSFLSSCFDCISQDISVEEKYSEFRFKCKLASLENMDVAQLRRINNQFHREDFWRLVLLVGENDPISLASETLDIDGFIEKVENEKEYLQNEECSLRLEVNKKPLSRSIAIYDFPAFNRFLGSIGTRAFLDIIKPGLDKNGIIEFSPFDDYSDSFYSEKILFNEMQSNVPVEMYGSSFKDELNAPYSFRNQESYPYEPNFFRLLKKSDSYNNLSKKLEILEGIFEIVRIFDLTWFEGNHLCYRLDGYKSIVGKIDLDSAPLESRDTYWKIYRWIHSERGSVVDKLGIARNVLSVYLSSESLLISEDVYFSTQSAFRTYLQKNLDRYIEIREKLNEQLSLIVQKINDLANEYVEGYQKSNFTFVSFFISVFLVQVLSTGEFEDVFTKDATILSFLFLFISFLYFCFLSWNIGQQTVRIRRRYQNLKSRFGDLLIEQDIQKILVDDKEFDSEMSFFNRRRWLITVLWLSTILLFLGVIITLSSYSNWDFLKP